MKTLQFKSTPMVEESGLEGDGMEGARRATGVPSPSKTQPLPPDPEVCEKKPRRRFTTAYKLRILKEYDSCSEPGEIGALLRRYGLYHSNIKTWLRQRNEGVLQGLSPKKRGRKTQEINPLAKEVARLQSENKKLSEKLKMAETIIEVQKKISEILRIPQNKQGETS
jgi:transposase-like protein